MSDSSSEGTAEVASVPPSLFGKDSFCGVVDGQGKSRAESNWSAKDLFVGLLGDQSKSANMKANMPYLTVLANEGDR